MAYYWLYFKDSQERVKHFFLLQEKSDDAALARAAAIDRGDLHLELHGEDGLVARHSTKVRIAEFA